MATSYGIISNYLENKIARHMLRGEIYTMPRSSMYIALHTTTTGAGDGNTGTEKSGNTYTRKLIYLDQWETCDNGITNSTPIYFSEATAAWGTIYGWGIYDALSNGNLLFWGLFDTSVYINTGEILKIPAEKIRITFGQTSTLYGGWTSFSIEKMQEWLLNGTSFNWTVYGSNLALLSAVTTSASNILTGWTEISGTGYQKKNLTIDAWNFDAGNSGRATNLSNIVFSESVEENWGTITDVLLFDNDTMTNPIFWGKLSTPVTINAGDGFKIPAGALSVQFF